MDDGIVTNQKGLFIALTEAGFAAGNESYRSPCPTGTFVPHLENFKYNTALEAECIPCPPGESCLCCQQLLKICRPTNIEVTGSKIGK